MLPWKFKDWHINYEITVVIWKQQKSRAINLVFLLWKAENLAYRSWRLRVCMAILHASVRRKSIRKKPVTKRRTEHRDLSDEWLQIHDSKCVIVRTSQSVGSHMAYEALLEPAFETLEPVSSTGLFAPFAVLVYLTCWQTRRRWLERWRCFLHASLTVSFSFQLVAFLYLLLCSDLLERELY